MRGKNPITSPRAVKNLEKTPVEKAQLASNLEKVREKLMESLESYKKILDDTFLLENKSALEKKGISDNLNNIIARATSLNSVSAGEGDAIINMALLNALLIVNNNLNTLKYEVYYLSEDIKKLAEKQEPESEGEQ